MCVTAGISKKFTKNPYSEGSRSSTLTPIKSLSLLLVMISSMSVPLCNHFHVIRANNCKITSFRGFPSLTPSFEGNPHTQGHEILSRKTSDLEAAHSENFVILGVAVLIQCQGVTDGRTDAQAMAKTREAFWYHA